MVCSFMMDVLKLGGKYLMIVWAEFSTLSLAVWLYNKFSAWHAHSHLHSWKLGPRSALGPRLQNFFSYKQVDLIGQFYHQLGYFLKAHCNFLKRWNSQKNVFHLGIQIYYIFTQICSLKTWYVFALLCLATISGKFS